MRYNPNSKKPGDNIEIVLQDLNHKIEALKLQYNLYFQGELRVPPEKEREDLEKRIRNLLYGGKKNARVNLLVQNVSSRFSLYNNMWLKRLKELETGISTIPRKVPKVSLDEGPKPKPKKAKPVKCDVSLNSEDSFDKFYDNYAQIVAKKSQSTPPDKDKIINSLKMKLISANLVDAKVSLGVEGGKLKIKVKGVQ